MGLGLVDDRTDLVLGDYFVMRPATHAEQPEYARIGLVERPVQRKHDSIEPVQWIGQGEGDRRGLANGVGLWHLFADDNMQ